MQKKSEWKISMVIHCSIVPMVPAIATNKWGDYFNLQCMVNVAELCVSLELAILPLFYVHYFNIFAFCECVSPLTSLLALFPSRCVYSVMQIYGYASLCIKQNSHRDKFILRKSGIFIFVWSGESIELWGGNKSSFIYRSFAFS